MESNLQCPGCREAIGLLDEVSVGGGRRWHRRCNITAARLSEYAAARLREASDGGRG